MSQIQVPPPGSRPRAEAKPRIGQDRPRLVVLEGIELTTPLDPYLTLCALARYGSCSVRWLRDRLTDTQHPLPCFRLPGGKILVRRSDFDGWLTRYRAIGRPDVQRVVDDVLGSLGAS
jgi:hypothetical protein